MATGNSPKAVTAGIWWSKARMGWSEKSFHEHTGKDGGDIQHRHEIDFSSLTKEERDAIRPLLERRAAAAATGVDGAGSA